LSRQIRRLAAIMFTDMIGYTALSQRDEALSLALVEQQRKIIRPILKRNNGREVKTMGDAFLVEFQSALEAATCGYDVQGAIRKLNLTLPEDKRVHLRVGIHVGDVVESEKDISGDAVNVASRIESFADDGGVTISRQVYDHIHNKFDHPLVSEGTKSLKNVSQPLEVFRIVMPWNESKSSFQQSSSDRTRIAVLPFANMSPDSADEYFADGMTEELIASLSGIRELAVIARTSVMRYKATQKSASEIARELRVGSLIEGSVRKAGNRIRVATQLIDAASESHIWAQNYDRQLDDIFAIQTEIAERVAAELRVQLIGPEKTRLETKPTDDAEAYLLYMRGRHYWNERTSESLKKAIACFERAIIRDRGLALGYCGLADCYAVMARNGQAESGPSYRKAKALAAKALKLDQSFAEAHATVANVLLYYDHKWKEAESEFRRALNLKPNYSTAHQWYSHLLISQRRFAEGAKEIAYAHRLDPFSPIINHNVAAAKYYRGKFSEAIAQFKKVIEMDPSHLLASAGPTSLIQVYVHEGLYKEAWNEVELIEKASRTAKQRYHNVGMPRAWRAYVLAATGRGDDARNLLQGIEPSHRNAGVSPYLIGLVYFVLGDLDSGFRWLEKSYKLDDGGVNWIAVDYELESVGDDSRFIALLDKVGLGSIGPRR